MISSIALYVMAYQITPSYDSCELIGCCSFVSLGKATRQILILRQLHLGWEPGALPPSQSMVVL